MQGTIITLDVSKGNCHYQGFSNLEASITKPRILKHTQEGFSQLLECQSRLIDGYGTDVVFVFEATGVYHRSLQRFLDDHKLAYFIISPLQAAKFVYCKLKVDQFHGILPLKKGPLVFFILWVMK